MLFLMYKCVVNYFKQFKRFKKEKFYTIFQEKHFLTLTDI